MSTEIEALKARIRVLEEESRREDGMASYIEQLERQIQFLRANPSPEVERLVMTLIEAKRVIGAEFGDNSAMTTYITDALADYYKAREGK